MELKNNTPNYKIDKEEKNEKLKYELEELLEKELEKTSDDIDVEKTDSIVSLLSQLQGKNETEQMDKDTFAKKYLKGYISEPKSQNKYGVFISIKVASIILVFIMVFGFGNYLSVKATNRGILSNIKNRVDVFYFEVIKKDHIDSIPIESFSEEENHGELEQRYFSSWEEAKQQLKMEFKIPCYIPSGFEEEKICYQKLDKNDFEISRSYFNDSDYIRLQINMFTDEGTFSTFVEDIDGILFEKSIGDSYVTAYKIQDNIHAFFQDTQFVYFIETNLEEQELIEFILEMRE